MSYTTKITVLWGEPVSLKALPTTPQWVPAPVAVMSGVWQSPISQRLVSDIRMQEVWTELRTKEVDTAVYEKLEAHDRPENFGHDFGNSTIAEIACGAMHNIALREFNETHVLPRSVITGWTKEWKSVAAWCRQAWQIDGAPLGNHALAAALEMTAQHFETLANTYPTKTEGARVLGKKCKTKGQKLSKADEHSLNVRRAQVTSFIESGDALFKKLPPKTLATFSSVALGYDVTPKQVEQWRLALSRPNKTSPSYKG